MICRQQVSLASAIAACVAALTVLSGCGPTRSAAPMAMPAETMDASVARGKVVFDTYCHSCHSQGEGGLGPALNNKPLPRFMIKFQVRRGMGVMPAFSEEQIPDSALDDLANYVAALRRHSR